MADALISRDLLRLCLDEILKLTEEHRSLSGCELVDLSLDGAQIAIDSLRTRLDKLPTVDAVKVVRCKDCEHYDPQTKLCSNPMAIGWDALEPNAEDFCSRGEKRRIT